MALANDKAINQLKLRSTITAKFSILNVRGDPGYASEMLINSLNAKDGTNFGV